MKTAVIFDLGNTLVSYYSRAQWPGVLREAIDQVVAFLREHGLLRIDPSELASRVEAENRERGTCDVVPLEDRLARIFDLNRAEVAGNAGIDLCRRFMKPIFATARCHDDVLPTLAELRRRGLKTGILSNTPWGSPAELWREELRRHHLLGAVNEVVFCRDVGYRKPAPQPFEFIMHRLSVAASECLFVGDDPRWDIVGPRAIGMEAVLIDRTGAAASPTENPIRSLTELLGRLE